MIDARNVPGGNAEGATAPASAPTTAARGNRFAKDRPPARDAAGRSLPSDKDLDYVALVLQCKQHLKGERPELARFWVESHHEHFKPALINEGTNDAVTIQEVTAPGGSTYLRYKMRCPKCRNEPVFTSALVEEALGLVYKQGARHEEHFVPV